jgi:hypothetical protein
MLMVMWGTDPDLIPGTDVLPTNEHGYFNFLAGKIGQRIL